MIEAQELGPFAVAAAPERGKGGGRGQGTRLARASFMLRTVSGLRKYLLSTLPPDTVLVRRRAHMHSDASPTTRRQCGL